MTRNPLVSKYTKVYTLADVARGEVVPECPWRLNMVRIFDGYKWVDGVKTRVIIERVKDGDADTNSSTDTRRDTRIPTTP